MRIKGCCFFYLGHHNGRQPAELQFTSGDAMGLNQTVQDPWEAQWIAKFDDKTISMIVLAAEWLGLTHLSMYIVYFFYLQIQNNETNTQNPLRIETEHLGMFISMLYLLF